MDEKLTDEQIKAISHFEGPAIVVAGPGSGKTRIITERVKYLINKKKVNPSNILVTTFTEKASNELKHRLYTQIGKDSEQVHVSTIHSLCKSLMEEFFYYHEFGIDFSVLDEDNQRLLISANKNRLELGGRRGWRDLIIQSAGYNSIYESLISQLYNFITENDINIEDVNVQLKIYEEIIKRNLSVREVEDIVSQIEELRDECQNSLDNMPEHLQESSDAGNTLQERIDGLEDWINEIQAIDLDCTHNDEDEINSFETLDDIKKYLDEDCTDSNNIKDYETYAGGAENAFQILEEILEDKKSVKKGEFILRSIKDDIISDLQQDKAEEIWDEIQNCECSL